MASGNGIPDIEKLRISVEHFIPVPSMITLVLRKSPSLGARVKNIGNGSLRLLTGKPRNGD